MTHPAPSDKAGFLQIKQLHKRFDSVTAVDDVSLDIGKGEIFALLGSSGCGKSTLLRCINRLEEHQQGRIEVAGIELRDDIQAVEQVRRQVGMVFQQFNLFPHLSVLDNLTLSPLWVGKVPADQARAQAMAQLERVHIADQAHKFPLQLSGGQQQRVAIARAYVTRPAIIIADEPTGNLDPALSVGIMKLLDRINREGTTVLMATHDSGIVDQMRKRVIELDGGHVIRDQGRGVYGYTG